MIRNCNNFFEELEYQSQSFNDYLEENENNIQKQTTSLKKLLKEYEENNIEMKYANNSQHDVTYPQFKEYKINRNDLCPCGSGKKYKKCCLKNNTFEKYLTQK